MLVNSSVRAELIRGIHAKTTFGTQTLLGKNFKIDVTCELVSHVQPLIQPLGEVWESEATLREQLTVPMDFIFLFESFKQKSTHTKCRAAQR